MLITNANDFLKAFTALSFCSVHCVFLSSFEQVIERKLSDLGSFSYCGGMVVSILFRVLALKTSKWMCLIGLLKNFEKAVSQANTPSKMDHAK